MSWILNLDAIGIEKEKALADFVNSFCFRFLFKRPGGLTVTAMTVYSERVENT